MPAGEHVVAGTALAILLILGLALATGTSAARGSERERANSTHAAVASAGTASVNVIGSVGRDRRTSRHIVARVARFVMPQAPITAESGQTVTVAGRLLTDARGLRVKLMARVGGGWRVVGHARTRRGGRFRIPYPVSSVGATALRVSLEAPGMARETASAGQVVGLAPAVASWYYDAGNTACGFHATYGVANLSLPCGAKVTIAYGGRSVVATVDDRGPYVYGRSFDLDQNTARALGMYGVAEVFTSA